MNKSKPSFFILFLVSFFSKVAFGQDSLFIINRYKWELGIGIDASHDISSPFSILLKKHISARTALRFGLGFNYDKVFEKALPVIEDYDTRTIFIVYEIDRKEKKLGVSLTSGIQRNYSVKNFNIYGSWDLVAGYKLHNIELPNGIRYFDVRIPNNTSFTTAKQNKKTSYDLGLKSSLGLQYPFSKKISISFESSLQYRATYNNGQDFYYVVSSDDSGNIGIGSVDGLYDKNWNYHLNVILFSLLIFNYHFN